MLIKENDPNRRAKQLLAVYRVMFGPTPLKKRLEDISEETLELVNYTSEANLREELSDLLSTCYALAAEKDWSVDDLLDENLAKLRKRHKEGHYIKTGEAIECQPNK